MNLQMKQPGKSVDLFVKNIIVFENEDESIKTSLPFFADGYPGLIFHQSAKGLSVNPHNKQMPLLFIYGQTIKPVQLELTGPYIIIIFQFYPFVLKSLFNISPESINDNCYDLSHVNGFDSPIFSSGQLTSKDVPHLVESITAVLCDNFEAKRQHCDFKMKQVIETIIASKGQKSIADLAKELKLNARTLERRFLGETGLSPKQFAKIIQFQSSMAQLTLKEFTKLSDIVYENGYADHSHFVRVFKSFTGKTPKAFSI